MYSSVPFLQFGPLREDIVINLRVLDNLKRKKFNLFSLFFATILYLYDFWEKIIASLSTKWNPPSYHPLPPLT